MTSAVKHGRNAESARLGEPPASQLHPPARVSAYDCVLLYVGCTSLAIMALIATFLFSPVRALALGLLLALVAARAIDIEERAGAFVVRLADPWLAGSVLLAVFLRANVSTNYMGGLDPGLYVNLSGVIEHTGGPYFVDLLHAQLPDALRALYERATMEGVFALPDGLRYEISFYPLNPGWMAVFSGILGADAHGFSVVFFSLLGVTGAYVLARELSDANRLTAARLTAVLTAVNPALCYLAKMPLSEAQSTALILNAAYLLIKALKATGRTQLVLLGISLALVIGSFFARLSFPILVAPWLAVYVLSRSARVDAITGRRLRGYLWMALGGLLLALLVYRRMLPTLFHNILDVYASLIGRHPYVLGAALALAGCAGLAAAAPFRARVETAVENVIPLAERIILWLPLVMLLASLPTLIDVARNGQLTFPGTTAALFSVVPGPSVVRYHLIYRFMLAATPFLLGVLLALPLVTRNRRLAIPVLFVCGVWALSLAFSPLLPNLYYHIRFVASELVPFTLVIVALVLVDMWDAGGGLRQVAAFVGVGAVATMLPFSALQLGEVEGEDARFFHRLDMMVSPNDVLFLSESEVGNRITVPLRYYFNKQVFVLPRDTTSAQARTVMRYLLDNQAERSGQVLVLSSRPASVQPFELTLKSPLQMRESGISNSENLRFDPIQSASVRHMFLPSTWRTNFQTLYLYRVTGMSNITARPGCLVEFGAKGNSAEYVVSGWGGQEATFRWTVGGEAQLHVDFPPGTVVRSLRLTGRAFARPGGSQRVEILVDGKEAVTLTIDDAFRSYDIDLGTSVAPGEHRIVFRLPDAHSPLSVGFNDDARVLGIAVSSLAWLSSESSPAICDESR
jgi:hypothetical protein